MAVAGDKVQFDIEGSRMDSVLLGTGGVTVTEMGTRAQVTTDSAGKAKITVKGGPTNTNFRLKVSDVCDLCMGTTMPAAPIQFAIIVTDQQIGSLSVSLAYTGHMTASLKTFDISLYKGTHVDCAVNKRRGAGGRAGDAGAVHEHPQRHEVREPSGRQRLLGRGQGAGREQQLRRWRVRAGVGDADPG